MFGFGVVDRAVSQFLEVLDVSGIPAEFMPEKKVVREGINGMFSKSELKENDVDIITFSYLAQLANDIISSDAYGGQIAMYSEALVRFGNRMEKKLKEIEHRLRASELLLVQEAYTNLESAREGLAFKV